MSQTTMIYRHVNYKNRTACHKSLMHSLRIKTNNFKHNEWIEELAENNLIFTANDTDGSKLQLINKESSEEYINYILSTEFSYKDASTKTKADFKKYEYKLKQKILTSTDKNESLLAEKLQFIADNKSENYREIIDSLDNVKRKKQLLTMLDKYMSLSKKVAGTTDSRESKIHEAFFKFPHQYGVKPEPKKMAECIRSFYEKYLPNHDIHLLVVHDDERTKDMKTGAHPHIFVSTKDNKTGERNLNKKLRLQVNAWLKANPQKVAIWSPLAQKYEKRLITSIDESVGKYQATKLQGMIVQDMFMQHIRAKFTDLKVVWSEHRQHRTRAFYSEYEDAKRPKADRTYNLHNYLLSQLDSIKLENKNQLKIEEKLKNSITEKKALDNRLTDSINDNQMTNHLLIDDNNNLSEQVSNKRFELSNLNQEISQSESKLEYIIKKAKAVDAAAKISIEKFMKMYTTMLSCFFDKNIHTAKTASSCALDEFSNANKPARKSIIEIALEDQKQLENKVSNEAVEVHNNLIDTMININKAKSRQRLRP